MDIVGNGFPSGSRILFDGQDRFPFSVNSTVVTMGLQPQDLATVGTHSVRIVAPSGQVSNEFTLPVEHGTPVISSLSTESARLGSSGSKVSVWGRGFTQSTQAEVNGTTRPVTLSFSATPRGGEKRLEFELAAADLAKPGAVSIRLKNPASGLTSEDHLVFLPIESARNAAVWDSSSQRFLMAVFPNAIVAVDPATGTRGAPVIVGSDPRAMAISRDGTKLFVALEGEQAIARFALPGLTLDAKYPSGASRVQSIVAAPFINDLIAVNFEGGGVAIFDSNGRRATSTSPSEGSVFGIQFGADPSILYGTNGPILQVMSVVPAGVTIARTLASGTLGNQFVVAEGKAFGTTGRVIDLSSGALLASLPANNAVAIDAQAGFLLAWTRHRSTQQPEPISVYDAKTLQKLGETGPAYPAPTSGTVSRFATGGNTFLSYVAENALVIGPDLRFSDRLPPVPARAVGNAATFRFGGPVAPGLIAVAYGDGIGPSSLAVATPENGYFPTTVGGTSVLFDDVAAPMIYSRRDVVAFVVPYSVAGRAQTQMRIRFEGRESPVQYLEVFDHYPGIFTQNSSGSGAGAILNQDGTLNTPSNPAQRGSIVSLYMTGGGQTDPPGRDGQIATAVLPKPTQQVLVQVDNQSAKIEYAGAAPQSIAGLMQVNFRVPETINPRPNVEVTVGIRTLFTATDISPWVTMAVQ